jgi:hypothetical protein
MIAVLALSISACTNEGRPTAFAASTQPATVAFESVDGPPVAVFQNLVATLTEETAARKVAVVSREGAAAYRVRTYMAVRVERQRPYIDWVWDVYDADKRRALRISGVETGAAAARDPWAAADVEVLRRIARRGLDRLIAHLGAVGQSPAGEPATPAPDQDGKTAVAASQPAVMPAALERVPMPPRRPQRADSTPLSAPAGLAFAVHAR